MTTIGDEVVQAAIVAKLKSLAPFQGVQGVEVRELEWQGDTFTYPNVRVELEYNSPYFDEQLKCTLQRVEFSVYCFSEQRSSKECSQVKSAVINAMTSNGFSNQSLNIKFLPVRIVDNVPAVREDEHTWRSQVKFGTKVSNL